MLAPQIQHVLNQMENPAPPTPATTHKGAGLPLTEVKNYTHMAHGQLTSFLPYCTPKWLPPLEGFPESTRPSLVPRSLPRSSHYP